MTLLVLEDLHKHFGETRAVDGVSLAIRHQELVSLVGPNGAGKTTLVNLVSGLLLPDRGRILFREADVTRLPVPHRVRAGIARSFQIVHLFEYLTALDNVRVALFARDGKIRTATALAERDEACLLYTSDAADE